MKPSVSSQLLSYLQSNHGVFASGDMQRMEWRNKNGSLAVPRTIVRRLEELAEDGKIKVELRGQHAFYSAQFIPPAPTYEYREVERDGSRVMERVLVNR